MRRDGESQSGEGASLSTQLRRFGRRRGLLEFLPVRKRLAVLQMASKVRVRKLLAVAKLAPALASWVRRMRMMDMDHSIGFVVFTVRATLGMRCRFQRSLLGKRVAGVASASEGGQQALTMAGATVDSPKRQSRPSSRADGGGVT